MIIDCEAILDGPFIGSLESYAINHIDGNETDPAVIVCQMTCLDFTRVHNPTLALIVTKLEKFRIIPKGSSDYDTIDGLYQRINYTSSPEVCEEGNNITQYSFAIYPTIKLDRSVVRCGVSYHPGRTPCWGEPVGFIRYVNSSMMNDLTPMECTPPLNIGKYYTTDA